MSAQVIWQRHLAILTGSEVRSLSLVVAVFLLGLAGGYYVFGLLTEKQKSRFLLLRYYGYVELLTGIYIGCFAIYFEFLKYLSFHSPNLFFVDLLISLIALLLPTFLMGAGIPLLTATLPDTSKEINTVQCSGLWLEQSGGLFWGLAFRFLFHSGFRLKLKPLYTGCIKHFSGLCFYMQQT